MARTARTRRDSRAKAQVDELFDRLRAAGFDTIEGDICCSGCATNDPRITSGDGPGAYYHEQNVEDGYRELYVGFCVDRDAPDEDARALRAGAAVAGIAAAAGFDVEWNGESSRKVLVRADV